MKKIKLSLITAAIISLVAVAIWQLPIEFNSDETISEYIGEEEDEEQKRINAIERMKHEHDMLKDPKTGKIPAGVRQKAIKAAKATGQFHFNDEKLPAITITAKGPDNYGGRTRALAFDVRHNNVVLAGGVSGGIYRSVDNGATWTRVTPAGEIHNLTTIAQDPRPGSQDTWYAGTGENIGNSTSGPGGDYYGHGIWKSVDNGVTWSALSSTQGTLEAFDSDFDYISRIVVSPSSGAVLVSAGEAIQRSTDGGSTWASVKGASSIGLPGDIIYNSGSSKFYAAIHGSDATNGGIWESSDDGATWSQIRTGTQLHASGVKRIVIANVANTNGIVVYYQLDSETEFTCGNSNTSGVGLHHYDGTSTWTDHTDKISNCTNSYTAVANRPTVMNTQGGYNMCITTKPNDADLVYLGGVEIYRYNLSTNAYDFIGGSQASANADNLHVDNHILLFEDNDVIWAGNDGGLRETDATGAICTSCGTDNGYNWDTKSNGYITYQFYGADIHPTNGSSFLAGAAQDNAFTIHPTSATAKEIGPTVDGTDVGIISGTDFNTYSILASFQNGGFVRLDNGVETDITPFGQGQGFHSTFYLDADNIGILYYPASTPSLSLYRTRNAAGLVDGTIGSDPTAEWQEMTGVAGALGANISAFDVSRDDSYGGSDYTASNANRKLYFGTADGKVFRLNDPAFAAVGSTPVDITPGTASGNVSDIAVNPYDDNEILVTYSNYNTSSVWHTTNANTATPTWTNVEGPTGSAVELASARSALIAKANNALFYMVGTSTGLYATDALSGATTSWTRVGTNSDIGLAVSVELRLRTSDNKAVLGTHGNGLFLLEFPPVLPVEMTYFTGKVKDQNNVQLDWGTATEIDNEGFDIERSIDGQSYEKVGFVAGNGTSYNEQSYSYTDINVPAGKWYYRLKQVDGDGAYEYSQVITVNISSEIKELAKVFPNPTRGAFTIELNQVNTDNVTISLHDRVGRIIRTTTYDNRQNTYSFDNSDLPSGIYFVKVAAGNFTQTIRVVKL